MKFEYHTFLHHSQTHYLAWKWLLPFEYHTFLHHSQTSFDWVPTIRKFEYHTFLHHSQTRSPFFPFRNCLSTIHFYIILKQPPETAEGTRVWVPYIFTSFSNSAVQQIAPVVVWVPYIFTSFSNQYVSSHTVPDVWVPYIFTSFSNMWEVCNMIEMFEYHTFLHHSQTTSIPFIYAIRFEYHTFLHHSQTPDNTLTHH